MTKTDEEIQAEIDNPNTKALIIMPAAKNAYLANRITFNGHFTINSVINDDSITLKGFKDIVKRQALVGMMIFAADDDESMAERIDEFVGIVQEDDGDTLDCLAPERVQKQFQVGVHG